MSKLTKTCAVRSCKYSKGTRENVKMFRVPKDDVQQKLWKDTLGVNEDEILQGLVCINHFDKKDISVTKTDTRLKKSAIPLPIVSHENEQSISTSSATKSEQSLQQCQLGKSVTGLTSVSAEVIEYECERCNINLAEMNNLRDEHLKMKMVYELKISKLENLLHMLQEKLTSKTQDTQLLKKQLEYSKITKEKLKATLSDLKKQNLLCKEVLEFVQVRLALIFVIGSHY